MINNEKRIKALGSRGTLHPSSLPIVSSSRNSLTFTYIAGAAEAIRDEGGDDHERDNNLDRSGYVGHLA